MTSILFLVETIQCKQFRCICRKNKKLFLNFFVHFSNLHQILNIFKERWPSEFMYFRNYGPRKTWSGKCLKSPVLDHRSTGNMVNGPKHWFNLNGSSFTIFVHHCESHWVGKSHSQWYANSEDFSLTHWLPMTSILFLVERIQCKQFRCLYRKNKSFLKFFCAFLKSTSNFEHFQKKMTLIAYVFPKIRIPKNVVK